MNIPTNGRNLLYIYVTYLMTDVFIADGWDYIFHLEQSGWPKDCIFLRLLEAKEFSFSLDKEGNILYDGMFDEIVPPLAICLLEL